MKLRYLYALPILATALMGCDEIEYSDAKPVENPQLPEVTQTDFSITPSAALAQGINLDELSDKTSDPNSYMVELYTINVLTENLPSGAVLSGGIQFAMSNEYTEVFDLSGVVTNEGVVSVPLSSLIYTRGTMISAADPREYTIYYRIPVYVTLDGGQYKLGDKDFFYNDGDSFNEIGIYPGYTVEEAYYLLGPNGTDISTAVKFDDSGYNIYDNSDFSVTAVFAEGNSSWVIVPESAYQAALTSGSLNYENVYGPEVKDALTGNLELGGAAGAVTDDTKYVFSFNARTLEYSITEKPKMELGDPTGIYIRGSMNGWDPLASYEFIGTEDPDVYIIPYVELPASSEFKVADTDWSMVNLGGSGAPIVPGTEYPLNGGDNISLEAAFTGSVILTATDGGSYTLLLQPFQTATAGQPSAIYIRGGMNDWGVDEAYEFSTSDYANVWYLENQTLGAGVEFKVADKDWSTINYGTSSTAGAFDETADTGILGLVYNGGNITLAANFTGTLRLVSVNNNYYLYFILSQE